MVKRLPTMWETWVRSLGWEDPLEKEMATHSSSCLENPMDRTQVSHIVGRRFTIWATREVKQVQYIRLGFLGGSHCEDATGQSRRPCFDPWVWKIPWRREWLPTLVFLPGESNGQRSLVDYNPWGCKELDTTEWLSTHTEMLTRLYTCIKLLILAVILWDRCCYFPF